MTGEIDGPFRLECGAHGSTPWKGECICAFEDGGCGTLHLIEEGAEQHPCCDAYDVNDPSKTLRAICNRCFTENGGAGARVVLA